MSYLGRGSLLLQVSDLLLDTSSLCCIHCKNQIRKRKYSRTEYKKKKKREREGKKEIPSEPISKALICSSKADISFSYSKFRNRVGRKCGEGKGETGIYLFVDEVLRASSVLNEEGEVRGRATNNKELLDSELYGVLGSDCHVCLSHHTCDIHNGLAWNAD